MKTFRFLTLTITLLGLADSSEVLAQGRGDAYGGMPRGAVPRRNAGFTQSSAARDADRRGRENLYKAGFNAGHLNNTPKKYFTNHDQEAAYHNGYAAGSRQREAEAAAARQEEERLIALYGSRESANQWRIGQRDGARGSEARPPSKEDPSGYIAYMEGHHAGKLGRAEAPTAPRADEAQSLSSLFIEQLNSMALQSQRYYLLLEATNADFKLASTEDVSLEQSIARTRLAMERAQEAFRTHLLLHQHSYAASQLHPRLVQALKVQATHLLGEMDAVEFEGSKQILHAKADSIAAEMRRLEAEPVTVPRDFERVGRYHKETIRVMANALDADNIRHTLASGQDDPVALRAGMREYVAFTSSWRDGQLREWQRDRLQRLFEASGSAYPARLEEEARSQVHAYLPPQATPQPKLTPVSLATSPAGVVFEMPTIETIDQPSTSGPIGLFGWLMHIAFWGVCGIIALILLCALCGFVASRF